MRSLHPVLIAASLSLSTVALANDGGMQATLFKNPSCGCCSAHADHLRASGIEVDVVETNDLAAVKRQHGIAAPFEGCHTMLLDGYVIEGHVPAEDIQRLLEDGPDALGLAVPGMPMGSPGMEGAYADSYDVLLMKKDGTSEVFAQYR
ncbi:MAG: DUF411 domain-containing protein [Alphaproteobacteria bacterium]